MIRTQIQKCRVYLYLPSVLFTFTPSCNHLQNWKAQVILRTSYTVEAALTITISQVSEEILLFIIIIIVIINYFFMELNLKTWKCNKYY